jgi:hypothetical protein
LIRQAEKETLQIKQGIYGKHIEKYNLEIGKKSLTLEEGVIEWEDDFIRETITKKIIPATGKIVELKTQMEKLARDEMELMFSFSRKNSKEKFGETPEMLKNFRKMFLITY